MTSIENLSNEIFYEIFDYLNVYDIYTAFSNLNTRFEQLITSSTLLLKIKVDHKSQLDMKYHCRHVVIPNKHRIISLHLWDSKLLEAFFKHCIIDSSFTRLESIVLYELSIYKLATILFYLKSLPRLFVLTINLDDDSSVDLSEIYRMIFCLPFLKCNSLSLYGEGESNVLVPLAVNDRFSTIESLIINHRCTLNGLVSIIHHTPRLNRLNCYSLVESNDKIENEISIKLSNLTHASFGTCHVKFADFEKFIKRICSRLKVLCIWEFSNTEYTELDQWKQLILQNIYQLRQFDLKCNANLNDDHFNSFIHQFTSRFWIEQGWTIGLDIQPEKIFYSININRKTGFNCDKNTLISSCRSLTQDGFSSTPVDLSITDSFTVKWSLSFIDKFSPILLAIQFTRLFISCRDFSTVAFVKIIGLLPNLDSIQMSYPPLQQLGNSSIKDAENLRLISISNKIKKVSQSSKLELTTFLINLCPRMEHLEVSWTVGKDLEKFVRLVLTKTITNICHLRSLCFQVYNANDEMINDLQNMIDSEKLLFDYNIKRKYREIFLQWK